MSPVRTFVFTVFLHFTVLLTWSQTTVPSFRSNASVHDPSVIQVGSRYYIFGSHLVAAYTTDWMNWKTISTNPYSGNTLIPDVATQMAESFAWSSTDTFWAPDVRQLADGKFHMYYCTCEGSSPRSTLGIAVADSVEGPYYDQGIILKSGMWGETSEDGTIYNATVHPNVVDPAVFYDKNGGLWMVYGSYSGGIFIMQLDPATGLPLPGQGYGKRLMGGNHSRIEGAYILYNPNTDYYYLFVSFGGLASDGGYNIRVSRSRTPNGTYYDSAGRSMLNAKGPYFLEQNDPYIAPYGVKLIGNYQFLSITGEPKTTSVGYLSPGHNSAFYDSATGKFFIIFHTRFVGRGEQFEDRVHQLYFNTDGWPVIAPRRYGGETLTAFAPQDIPGAYKMILHGKDITTAVKTSTLITLRANGTIDGNSTGSWSLSGTNDLLLTVDSVTYKGIVSRQWDDNNSVWVNAFSALSIDGAALWGSQVAISSAPPVLPAVSDQQLSYGETLNLSVTATGTLDSQTVHYTIDNAPEGLAIDDTGLLIWTPLPSQAGQTYHFTLHATDSVLASLTDQTTFAVTVGSAGQLNRLDLDFTTTGNGGLLDATGQATGFTRRLPGTGTSRPVNDTNLVLDTTTGALDLKTTQSDYNNQTGIASQGSPGIALSDLGFTGTEDFVVTARFAPLPAIEFIDQIGAFVGVSGSSLTRAGTIVFDQPELYTVHTLAGVDQNARFGSGNFDGSSGMTVTIARQSGLWRYFVNGIEWNPATEPDHLNNTSALVAGVFAITPFNANVKTVRLESFSVAIATGLPGLTPLETWRTAHFGTADNSGSAANTADPDHDGLSNLLEYALSTDPQTAETRPPLRLAENNGHLNLSFQTIADSSLTYTVEACDDLLNNSWSPVWTQNGEAVANVTVDDPALISDHPRRFLRLKITQGE